MSSGHVAVVWSQAEVAYVDAQGQRHSASTLGRLVLPTGVRSAVILIAHRNSLIRLAKVPNLNRAQLEPLIKAKTNSLFPAGTQGYSFGYRIASDASGSGKLAILGGVKSETLRKIHREAQSCGIKVLAVLPAGFASWLASVEKHVRTGIVISQEGSDTCFDVISEGELVYSRFTQLESLSDLDREVEATFQTAGLAEGPTLVLGNLEFIGTQGDPREPSSFASDLGQLQRSLFSLELPEEGQKREKKRVYFAAQRGVALLVIAIAAWTFAVLKHQRDDRNAMNALRIERALSSGENQKFSLLEKQGAKLRQTQHLLNVAFDPAQTFGDMVNALGANADGKIWLTGLSLTRGGTISIRGGAKDQKSISTYVDKLRGEPRFRDVELRFSTQGQLNNVPIHQFAITAWGVGNLPFDQYVEAASK